MNKQDIKAAVATMTAKERELIAWAEDILKQKAEELHDLLFFAFIQNKSQAEVNIIIDDFFSPYEEKWKNGGMTQEFINFLRNYILQSVMDKGRETEFIYGEVAGHA